MTNSILAAGQKSSNVSFSTAQEMINRFLTLDRIKTALDEGRFRNNIPDDKPEIRLKPFTKEELANKLGITLEEFEKLGSPDFYEGIASKISQPLNRLYCATKFADGEYKAEKSEQGGNHE